MLFLLANAPLLRTLAYVQVNLHALNFVLLSLLLYPKRQPPTCRKRRYGNSPMK